MQVECKLVLNFVGITTNACARVPAEEPEVDNRRKLVYGRP